MSKPLFCLIMILCMSINTQGPAQEPESKTEIQPTDVKKLLEKRVPELRAEKKLIGLGSMVMVQGKTVASAVDGKRQQGSENDLTIRDQWHLGSISKSVTATMLARLVEQKQLKWTSTVGEAFGDEEEIHADWKEVTLEQLLSHTSGAPPNFSIFFLLRQSPEGEKRLADRKEAVLSVLSHKPLHPPNETFTYSNVGYTIAAVMAEKKMKKSWEDLVRQEIFIPLGLKQAGFGPPKDGEEPLSQPRGHKTLGWFKFPVGPDDDNTPIMGPAGIINMSLDELCTYGNAHLQGELGKAGLLSPQTFKELHTARLEDYALGWVVEKESKWTNAPLIWHNGSNTMWYALVVLIPDKQAVIAITSNDGDIPNAQSAAIQIVKEVAELLE